VRPRPGESGSAGDRPCPGPRTPGALSAIGFQPDAIVDARRRASHRRLIQTVTWRCGVFHGCRSGGRTVRPRRRTRHQRRPPQQRVVGSVNANKRHWHASAAAGTRTTRGWAPRQRRVSRIQAALARQPDDVKVVIQSRKLTVASGWRSAGFLAGPWRRTGRDGDAGARRLCL
jgi:hypothetical protein